MDQRNAYRIEDRPCISIYSSYQSFLTRTNEIAATRSRDSRTFLYILMQIAFLKFLKCRVFLDLKGQQQLCWCMVRAILLLTFTYVSPHAELILSRPSAKQKSIIDEHNLTTYNLYVCRDKWDHTYVDNPAPDIQKPAIA